MRYLEAQSLGVMDRELVETFVHTGPKMLDFVEEHSELQFEIAEGFPDYKPELPGGRPTGGRSLNAKPFDLARLGEWRDRITSFPADFSNVGIDAETRARIHASVDSAAGDYCVAGTALIAGLLKGLLDLGVTLAHRRKGARTDRRLDGTIVGVRIQQGGKDIRVRARAGVVLGTGGFEWDEALVEAFLRGPMHGPVSPPNNTGDGLRMAMAHGADLANMGEAWWVPIIQIPGDTFDGQAAQPQRATRTHPAEKHHRQPGRQAIPQRGRRIQLDGGPVPPPRPPPRLPQRPGVDRVRLAAPQALRIPRRRARRPGPALVLRVEGPRRVGREDGHRRRRSGPHAGRVERKRRPRARSRLRPWLKRLRRLLGRQQRRDDRGQDARARSTRPRTTRCR